MSNLALSTQHLDLMIGSMESVFPVEVFNREFGILPHTKYAEDPVGFGRDVLGETYTDDIIKVMESVRDNPVTIAKSCNAPGKTHGAGRIAVWWYKSHKGAQVYTAAAPPESNLKKLLWGEIGAIIKKHPDLFEGDTLRTMHIERHPQEYLTGVTIPTSGTKEERVSKFSGKHAPYLLFIFDEGDAIPDEVYTATETCMSGGLKVRLLIMFNPKAQIGEAYRMERDGQAKIIKLSAFNHPNVITGEQKIPGAVTREATVRRINEWCMPLPKNDEPKNDCFKLPDYLVGVEGKSRGGKTYSPLKAGYYRVLEAPFFYMVLGEYPPEGSRQLISRELVRHAINRWHEYVGENGEVPPQYVPGIMGLDVGEYGEDPTAAVFRYGGYVERPETWQGVDTMVTGDRATALYKSRSLYMANVDAIGVGAGVAPQMQRNDCASNAVKVSERATEKAKSGEVEFGEFFQLRDQLWWACREWLRTDPGAMLPPDEQMTEELCTPTYKEDERSGKIRVTGKDVMRDQLKRSPNKADGLCLTFFNPGLLFPEV